MKFALRFQTQVQYQNKDKYYNIFYYYTWKSKASNHFKFFSILARFYRWSFFPRECPKCFYCIAAQCVKRCCIIVVRKQKSVLNILSIDATDIDLQQDDILISKYCLQRFQKNGQIVNKVQCISDHGNFRSKSSGNKRVVSVVYKICSEKHVS